MVSCSRRRPRSAASAVSSSYSLRCAVSGRLFASTRCIPAASARLRVALVSSAVTSTSTGFARACRAAKSTASSAVPRRPPPAAALASETPFPLPAASAASRRGERPRASNTKPERSTTPTTLSSTGFRRSFAIIAASTRPIWPKPSSTTSVRSEWVTAPPPSLSSWNAACTRRCARTTSFAATTTDRFSSEEPCAIAMTLIPPEASAVKVFAAMPGVPAIPSPTTAKVATPPWISTPSISRRAISSRNTSSRPARARCALASGTLKQIECSDDAWLIRETDTPCWCTAAKVRAAMPGMPSMPLPVTVTSACPLTADRAFTGWARSVRRREISVPRAPGSANGRMRMARLRPPTGMRARGWSTFAP